VSKRVENNDMFELYILMIMFVYNEEGLGVCIVVS